MTMQIGDKVLFTDEEDEEIREVTITGVTMPEDSSKAKFAYVVNDDEGNEWIVEPHEVEELDDAKSN